MNVAFGVINQRGASILPSEHVDELRREFPQHTFLEALDRDCLRETLSQAEAALASTIPKELIPTLTRLRWLQVTAAGVGHILSPELIDSPIVVTNARGVSSRAIAEHVIGVTIALARQIHVAIRRQVGHVWAFDEISDNGRGITLHGKRMGIVGLGSIGRQVAPLAAALGMRVSAVRRRAASALPPAGVERVLAADRLHELLEESDVVVLSAPLTGETEHLIDAAAVDRMKPRALLINVGRGRLIDDEALIAALRAGRIGAAALDVFTPEPLPLDSPYWDLPNVLVTPHVSSVMEDYWTPVVRLFADNLLRFERGDTLINVVDKRAGY